MSADAFDRLEDALRSAVRAQAAGVPPVRPRFPRRRWRGGLLAAAAALAVAGGGALAATQVWRVGAPDDSTRYVPAPTPDAGAGVVVGRPRILPLRVADPGGGPPWALRVFGSTRGGSCVQVGQVVDGRFGRMQGTTLRPVAAVPGQNSLCSFVARDGYPVLRGLRRVDVTGGSGRGPVTAVRTIRYGLLGPAAREVTWRDGAGRRLGRMQVDRHGGAYLLVRAEDPAPYAAFDRWQRAREQRMVADIRRLRAQGVSAREALRRANATMGHTRPRTPFGRVTDGIDATFARGATLRVAGHGRTSGPLPGVTRSKATNNPARLRAPLRVRRSGPLRSATFTIGFRAPVAITRADKHYTLTLTGTAGPHCDDRPRSGGNATTRNLAAGDPVSFTAAPKFLDNTTWCPGRHTLRVGYESGSGPFAGRLVGSWSFTVPR